MKTSLFCLCIFACCFVFFAATRSYPQNSNENVSAKKDVVIGHLQTREHKITISRGEKGTTYTVKTNDGKMLDLDLSEENFQSKYPSLYDQIKEGRAGNDASLRTREMPVIGPEFVKLAR